MTSLVALSVSIGALGGVATWLALGLLPSGYLEIWAIFIAWATFFAAGGNNDALKNTIVCSIFGVILAWVAGLVIVGIKVDLPQALWPAIVVAVTVFIIVIAAQIEWLSTIPANVLGYAAAFAYILVGNKLNMESLTAPTYDNPLIIISVSLAVGAIFGWVSAKLGDALTASE